MASKVPKLSQLETIILAALASKEQYGLEIVQTVNKITDGRQSLSLGSLYTTLHRMERKGLVAARWGEATEVRQGARRRYYRTAALGERALAEAKRVLAPVLRFARMGILAVSEAV